MRRREFIAAIGGAATWPLAVRAQQRQMPVIGFLSGYSRDDYFLSAFRGALAEIGYVDGRNVAIEYRFANNDNNRLREMAADLVRRQVTVIVAPHSTIGSLAAKSLSPTIPIVFITSDDPVRSGLVASYNRPGGNATGLSEMSVELGSKRFGLLHELLPSATNLAMLVNPLSPLAEPLMRQAQAVVSALGTQIEVFQAETVGDIDTVFASLAKKRVEALVVGPDIFFLLRRVQFASLAMHHGIPATYAEREFADVGGLMAYGTRLSEQYRQLAIYTGRILNGEKPADLAIMQPTRFEFVINLQTARIMGIEVPPTLLAIADEVIE